MPDIKKWIFIHSNITAVWSATKFHDLHVLLFKKAYTPCFYPLSLRVGWPRDCFPDRLQIVAFNEWRKRKLSSHPMSTTTHHDLWCYGDDGNRGGEWSERRLRGFNPYRFSHTASINCLLVGINLTSIKHTRQFPQNKRPWVKCSQGLAKWHLLTLTHGLQSKCLA